MVLKDVLILEIAYEEAEGFWKTHLWPDRPESWRPVSTMLFDGGFDMSIRENHPPTFWGAFWGNRLVGVNSGHFTSAEDFRSRGLCVLPDFRGKGIGRRLLQTTSDHARSRGARRVWSYPKLSSWGVYEKSGFEKTSRTLRPEDENRYAALVF